MDLLTCLMIGDDKLSTLSRSPIRVRGMVGCNQLDLTLSSFAPPQTSLLPPDSLLFFLNPTTGEGFGMALVQFERERPPVWWEAIAGRSYN